MAHWREGGLQDVVMIKTQNLDRSYPLAGGRYYVLRRINVDIKEGEFITIIDRKSTRLNSSH